MGCDRLPHDVWGGGLPPDVEEGCRGPYLPALCGQVAVLPPRFAAETPMMQSEDNSTTRLLEELTIVFSFRLSYTDDSAEKYYLETS